MWHIFWRGYSRLRSGREHWAWMVVVEVRQGTLGGDTRGWGPAGNTGRRWSWLRSGREHWAGMVVVEVRQGTLGVDGRGRGPAGNTGGDGRGWGPAGNTGRGWSWLRSDRDHCASRVAVEQEEDEKREEKEEDEDEEDEEEATDIKSNNPHLAGGEVYGKSYHRLGSSYHGWDWKKIEPSRRCRPGVAWLGSSFAPFGWPIRVTRRTMKKTYEAATSGVPGREGLGSHMFTPCARKMMFLR